MKKYSDFFDLDSGITNVEFSSMEDIMTGSFTIYGKRKVFSVVGKDYMDELYKLLVRSIRKDKLEMLNV